MPLITIKEENKKEKLKALINAKVLENINDYCNWAKIDINLFIEDAAKIIFKMDKEYRAELKARKTTKILKNEKK